MTATGPGKPHGLSSHAKAGHPEAEGIEAQVEAGAFDCTWHLASRQTRRSAWVYQSTANPERPAIVINSLDDSFNYTGFEPERGWDYVCALALRESYQVVSSSDPSKCPWPCVGRRR